MTTANEALKPLLERLDRHGVDCRFWNSNYGEECDCGLREEVARALSAPPPAVAPQVLDRVVEVAVDFNLSHKQAMRKILSIVKEAREASTAPEKSNG